MCSIFIWRDERNSDTCLNVPIIQVKFPMKAEGHMKQVKYRHKSTTYLTLELCHAIQPIHIGMRLVWDDTVAKYLAIKRYFSMHGKELDFTIIWPFTIEHCVLEELHTNFWWSSVPMWRWNKHRATLTKEYHLLVNSMCQYITWILWNQSKQQNEK